VIRGTDKNKQLTIIKPTQIGINRKKYTFNILKSLEPSKKFKYQPRPLVRPSFVNFCQHFLNLSHETVPLNGYIVIIGEHESIGDGGDGDGDGGGGECLSPFLPPGLWSHI
jgi:hypothetical protein